VEGDGGAAEVCPGTPTKITLTVTDSSGRSDGELTTARMTASATVDVSVPPACASDAGPPDAASWVYWADWEDVDAAALTGTLSPPSGAIQVVYSGPLAGSQTTTGADDFLPVSTFTSGTVADPPPGPGMLEVSGGAAATLTFSQPVTDPVIAIYSLGVGYANQAASLLVDASVTVLSSGANIGGTGFWGDETLTLADGGVSGIEGNGVIELEGTFSTIEWTNPSDIPYASFTGLTVGVRTQPRP
jgi:hypothetical protein